MLNRTHTETSRTNHTHTELISVWTAAIGIRANLCYYDPQTGTWIHTHVSVNALPCLIPSSFLRVGDHGHWHRRSPLIPVSGHSCTLRQWPPRPVNAGQNKKLKVLLVVVVVLVRWYGITCLTMRGRSVERLLVTVHLLITESYTVWR